MRIFTEIGPETKIAWPTLKFSLKNSAYLILFDDIERRALITSFLGEITAEKVEDIEVQKNPNCCEELLVIGVTFFEINTSITTDHTRKNG